MGHCVSPTDISPVRRAVDDSSGDSGVSEHASDYLGHELGTTYSLPHYSVTSLPRFQSFRSVFVCLYLVKRLLPYVCVYSFQVHPAASTPTDTLTTPRDTLTGGGLRTGIDGTSVLVRESQWSLRVKSSFSPWSENSKNSLKD